MYSQGNSIKENLNSIIKGIENLIKDIANLLGLDFQEVSKIKLVNVKLKNLENISKFILNCTPICYVDKNLCEVNVELITNTKLTMSIIFEIEFSKLSKIKSYQQVF